MKTEDNDKTAFGHRVQLAYDMPCGRPWRKVKTGWQMVNGERLKELRQACGMSQLKLATEAYNHQWVIDRLERGELKRQRDIPLSLIAQVLGVDVEELILDRDELECLP